MSGHQLEIRRQVSSKFIDFLKTNNRVWFNDVNAGYPTNAFTNITYDDINPVLLDQSAQEKGFTSKYWATHKEWRSLGCSVVTHPGGTNIVNVKNSENYKILGTTTLFNANQVFGVKSSKFKVNVNEENQPVNYEQVDKLIKGCKVDIKYGNFKSPKYFPPPKERICLPYRSKFTSDSQYYGAVLHELIHFAELKTGWNGDTAIRELVADVGQYYLEMHLNIPHCNDDTNRVYFRDTWIRSIEDDPGYLFEAVSQASLASEFILSLAKQTSQSEKTVI